MKLRSFWIFAAASLRALGCDSGNGSTAPSTGGGSGASAMGGSAGSGGHTGTAGSSAGAGNDGGSGATDARIDVNANCGKPVDPIAPAVPDVLRPPEGAVLLVH